jgi:CRISPR-associated endoribonuclease Cas6
VLSLTFYLRTESSNVSAALPTNAWGAWQFHGLFENALASHSVELLALVKGTAQENNNKPLYVLVVPGPEESTPAGTYSFGVRLFGAAALNYQEVVNAMLTLSSLHLGSKRTRLPSQGFTIRQVQMRLSSGITAMLYDEQETPDEAPYFPPLDAQDLLTASAPTVPTNCRAVSLTLLTPMTLTSTAKRNDPHLKQTLPPFAKLITRLIERAKGLGLEQITPFPSSRLELDTQIAAASDIQCEANHTYWYDYHYGSSTKKAPITFGGLLGEAVFTGAFSPEMLQILMLGRWLHLGQKASIGHGAYEVQLLAKR